VIFIIGGVCFGFGFAAGMSVFAGYYRRPMLRMQGELRKTIQEADRHLNDITDMYGELAQAALKNTEDNRDE